MSLDSSEAGSHCVMAGLVPLAGRSTRGLMEVTGAIRGRVGAPSRVVEPCAPDGRGRYGPTQSRCLQDELNVRQHLLRRNRQSPRGCSEGPDAGLGDSRPPRRRVRCPEDSPGRWTNSARCPPVLALRCVCFPLLVMDSRPLQLFSRTPGKSERPWGSTETCKAPSVVPAVQRDDCPADGLSSASSDRSRWLSAADGTHRCRPPSAERRSLVRGAAHTTGMATKPNR